MSKIANNGLTRSGTGCFIAIGLSITAAVDVKRINQELDSLSRINSGCVNAVADTAAAAAADDDDC